MREVYSADEPARAHLVKGYLVTNGIRADVVGDQPYWADGSLVPKNMRPTVRVADDDEEKALTLLRNWEEHRGEGEAWVCGSCGEDQASQFTDCWRCGAARAGTGG